MAVAVSSELPIHRLDIDVYGQMVRSGALEGQPVELLEGLLVEMSPQDIEHATIVRRLTRHLATAEAWLAVQLPLELASDSVPEPDLALVVEPSLDHHPRSALLVVEVSVSSHRIDRGVKAALYAKAEIPTYWLIDVPGRAVEVRTDPGPEGYRGRDVYRPGSSVPAPAQGVEPLDVDWLLEGIRVP